MILSFLFNFIGGYYVYMSEISIFSWIAAITTIFNKSTTSMYLTIGNEAFPT
jgi:hypothetical protein